MINSFERLYIDGMPQEKVYLTEKETKDYFCNKPPPIPMNQEMPMLEKAIKEGSKDAKSESETLKRKLKKVHSKSNKAAVASIQKKL